MFLRKIIIGKWILKNTCDTSTGWVSSGHNRFDFYLGAIYPMYNAAGGYQTFMQFSQSGNGWYGCLPGLKHTYPGVEKYSAHRAIHYGSVFSAGNPSSLGCNHFKIKSFNDWLYKTLKNQFGTRIIVY